MISGVDVKFLRSVVQGIRTRHTSPYIPCLSRSSVAIILRFGDPELPNKFRALLPQRSAKIAADDLLQTLEHNVSVDAPPSLQVLFVKRADIDDDRWSGSINFPGGRRDKDDDDDLATAMRETNEEIGMPLHSSEFIFLGRLNDYKVKSRTTSREGMVQSRFVFVHIGSLSPSLNFATHEIEAVQWYPVAKMRKEFVDRRGIHHPLLSFLRATTPDQKLLASEIFGAVNVYFPSITILKAWRVWGLPLRTMSELLEFDGRPAIDWPLFNSSSTFFQHLVVGPYHGYREIVEDHKVRDPIHQAQLAFVVALLLFLFIEFLYFIQLASEVVYEIVSSTAMDERKERIRESHKKTPYNVPH